MKKTFYFLLPMFIAITILCSLRSTTSLLLVRSEAFTYKILHHENINLQELNPAVPKVNLVYVEGGTFSMGDNPAHRVTVSDFYIMDTEVTQEMWTWVMGNNPSHFRKGSNYPVEQVSWYDTQTFIGKLNQRRGEIDPLIVEMGLYFSLPREAEWEFAARGGNKSRGYVYSGSNDILEVAWYDDNSSSTTHPVAQKKPNELGLYDMTGNVWEWCSDWYDTLPSYAETDPIGKSSGSQRVRRGASIDFPTLSCETKRRFALPPDMIVYDVGLRLVLRFN